MWLKTGDYLAGERILRPPSYLIMGRNRFHKSCIVLLMYPSFFLLGFRFSRGSIFQNLFLRTYLRVQRKISFSLCALDFDSRRCYQPKREGFLFKNHCNLGNFGRGSEVILWCPKVAYKVWPTMLPGVLILKLNKHTCRFMC